MTTALLAPNGPLRALHLRIENSPVPLPNIYRNRRVVRLLKGFVKRVVERIAAENARPAANVGEKRLRGRLYGTPGGQVGTPSETERLNYWLLRTVANKMYQQIQFRIMDMAI